MMRSCLCDWMPLRAGSLFVCYITLIESIVAILNLMCDFYEPALDEDVSEMKATKRNLMYFAVASVVIAVNALYGIHKRKPYYMLPLVGYKILIIILMLIVMIASPFMADDLRGHFSNKEGDDPLPEIIISIFFITVIEGYGLLILFFYLRTLIEAAANVPPVSFAATVVNLENGVAVNLPNGVEVNIQNGAALDEISKKQPPPPYTT